MTSRERVLTTIHRKIPDTVPIYEFVYSRPFFKEILGYCPEDFNAADVAKLYRKVGYDMCFCPFGGQGGFNSVKDKTGRYQDEWGTTYQKDSSTWPLDAPVAYPIGDESDWKNYTMPDPMLPSRLNGFWDTQKICGEADMAIIGSVRGPFSATMLLMGMENLSMSFYDDPEIVKKVMTACTDFFITGGRRMIEAGADLILIADDYGGSTAPLMSTAHFVEFILPQIKRQVAAYSHAGAPVVFHSDGNIKPFTDMMVDTGIAGLNPIERAAGMDLGEMKRKYGDRIALVGNVNNKTTLVTGSPSDVEAEVKECIQTAGTGGGYILCSDHSVHDDIPNVNVLTMIEAGRKYGRY